MRDPKPVIIVGLVGAKEAGKSSLADFIMEEVHELGMSGGVVGNADVLKNICMGLDLVGLDQLEDKDAPAKNVPDKTVRQVWQAVGNFFRSLWPDVWVHKVLTTVRLSVMSAVEKNMHLPIVVVVPDIRYENERELLKDPMQSGPGVSTLVTVMVNRAEAEELARADEDPSERYWESIPSDHIDYDVDNNGDIDLLRAQACEIVTRYIKPDSPNSPTLKLILPEDN